MKNDDLKLRSRIKKFTVIIVCLFVVSQAWAQYKITKHSINNGGGVSSNPSYQITGSIGQKDASNSSTGSGFSVTGGFWSARIDDDLIFKNGFE